MGQPRAAKVAAVLLTAALLGWLAFDALRPPDPFTSSVTGVALIEPYAVTDQDELPSALPLNETEVVIAFTVGRCLGRIPDLPETLNVVYLESEITVAVGPTPSSCDGDTDDVGFERSVLIELTERIAGRELVVTRTPPG